MLTVMTGGTRGIGRVAAERIAPFGTRVMGARDDTAVPPGWDARPLDLASLASVRAFVAALPDGPISHLMLNAGGQRPDDRARTVDGFETTFATNHLAQYLLLRLVLGRLAPGARVVLTTSGTHDPAEKTGVPAPRHAKAEWLAHPERAAGGSADGRGDAGVFIFETLQFADRAISRAKCAGTGRGLVGLCL